MEIKEIIEKVKGFYSGKDYQGNSIDDLKTRDQVLFGDVTQECTGIVTTCYCSIDVIKEAIEHKANLIICHESAFYNRGANTESMNRNKTLVEKRRLLEEHHIVVWRNHDYIHSGMMNEKNELTDGIFYGLMKVLAWDKYLIAPIRTPMLFELPQTNTEDLCRYLIEKLHLNGIKIIGNRNAVIKKVLIAEHIMGEDDYRKIEMIEDHDIDCVIAMECIDFTVSSYIKDAAELGQSKVILAVGHFNVEEPGMDYLAQILKDGIQIDLPVRFVQSGDMYQFITK
ncbi:Nif3-like dinuclear metal center hexameric protein [Anaerorhabdus sp.]|uniref:Nif3-like dinuclear metal center hexameric protein n=1 Tax=Anaerorhabdus sp. TaxID=1872524 RepID=UPI002FCC3B0F